MPTLREYLTKNISAIAARSALGPKLRQVAQGALLPALGDTKLEELTEEAITEWGKKRLAEPKKDGTARSQSSVEQELAALDDVVKHFHGGKAPAAKGGAGAGTGGQKKAATPAAPSGPKPKMTRGTQRGR